MMQKVRLDGIRSPMSSPLQRGQYVLTLVCGHLYATTRPLPFPDPFDWPDAPTEVDCKTCDLPADWWEKHPLNMVNWPDA